MSATRTVMNNHQSNGNVRVQGEHGNGLAGHQPKSRAHLSPPPHKSKFPLDFFLTELRRTLRQPESGRISAILAANLCSIAVSSYWSSVTNSLSLSAFNGVTWFHVMSLLTCYLTVFVKTQNQRPIRNVAGLSQAAPVTIDAYSLGYARLEVLAVFSATVLSQLGAVFVVKESLERMLDPPEIHP
jgi:zinc transporter 6